MGVLGNVKRGYDSLDEVEKRIEERKAAQGDFKPWRFWLKPKETASIIFLEDEPPVLEEHNLKVDGKWGNHFTCLKVTGEDCPLCEAGDRPSTVGFFTIIDRRSFETSKGEKRKDTIKVFAAKFKVLKQLKKFSEKYGGLTGLEFEVERSDEKAPSTGDLLIREDKHETKALLRILNEAGTKKDKEGNVVKLTDLEDVLINWEDFLKPEEAKTLQKLSGNVKSDGKKDEKNSGKKGGKVDYD